MCSNFILQALCQGAQHLYEKREGSGSGTIPLTNGYRYGSVRPKNIPNTDSFRHLAKNAREAVGVYASGIHGRGLFCKREISAGEMVRSHVCFILAEMVCSCLCCIHNRDGMQSCLLFLHYEKIVFVCDSQQRC